MAEINFTIYCVTGNPGKVPELVGDTFGAVMNDLQCETPDITYRCTLTLQDDTEMTFHVNADPAFLEPHLDRMLGFYGRNPGATDSAVMAGIRTQIALFNCVVGITFDQGEDAERMNALVGGIFHMADRMSGFVFLPDGRLMSPGQKVLIAPDGTSDYTAFSPLADTDLLDSPDPDSPEDTARKARSIERLRARGIPYTEHLPVVVKEAHAIEKSARGMAERCVALLGVAMYAQAICEGEPAEEARRYWDGVDQKYKIVKCSSQDERAYLMSNTPREPVSIAMTWRYECCAALLWALGLLPYTEPTGMCDVDAMSSLLYDMEDLDDLIAKANPRPFGEILDEADYILRCDWACVEARLRGEEAPAGLEPGVVHERHYALNWLVGANGNVGWDDIRPNT